MINRWILLAGLAVSQFTGCGVSGPSMGEVTGVVTLDGTPVPNLSIVFVPQNSEQVSPSYGSTDTEGRYQLLFNAEKTGAIVGTHQVTFTPGSLTNDDIEMRKQLNAPIPETVSLPPKFYKPGAHSADVKAGQNTIDFTLTTR